MLHTKFRGNRPAGSGVEDFLTVFTIYWHGGHLGHVTSIMSSDFYFLVPESFHKKMVEMSTVVLRKSGLTLGQGPEMTLIFNTLIPSYIQSDVCSY